MTQAMQFKAQLEGTRSMIIGAICSLIAKPRIVTLCEEIHFREHNDQEEEYIVEVTTEDKGEAEFLVDVEVSGEHLEYIGAGELSDDILVKVLDSLEKTIDVNAKKFARDDVSALRLLCPQINVRQLTTILVGLRNLQINFVDANDIEGAFPDFFTDKIHPLKQAEIDDLAELLNTTLTDTYPPRSFGDEWFTLTHLCRDDVRQQGYDPSMLDCADMEHMASRMHDAHMASDVYWESIRQYCDDNNIPKLKKRKNGKKGG